jgi:hypothetical protein
VYFLEDGRNAYVCGHHVKSRKAFPELTHEVSNGICLCLSCHTKVHNGEPLINDLIKH